DGRVMFAIPWHQHVVVGTTDTPIAQVSLEPKPLPSEIDFILDTAGSYLSRPPRRSDILSVFTGIRPLVNAERPGSTAALSREHTITISKSGLLTIAGGKWTTYRKMAEDCLEHAVVLARLPEMPCVTRELRIHGAHAGQVEGPLAVYGSDAEPMRELSRKNPGLSRRLHPALDIEGTQILWAVRNEMARTLDDVLARRTRALFLNAGAALEIAPTVAEIMARELGKDKNWEQAQLRDFKEVASCFVVH
ncbi:MAG TPA: glycerol-3-phosphate dehydrogenase C-terminal domain-containing protein, partial [Verrucomicrobiae bacterium]|nr:glycerol-3-phosphate dehydrogenase C-terminal domain-containing protein [Verrucomicrobiae bacterium]